MLNIASPREAAKRTGISENHIRAMIKTGVCPGYYCGKHFRVLVDKLEEQICGGGPQTEKEEAVM